MEQPKQPKQQKPAKASFPSEVEGWDGEFYVSKGKGRKEREQVLVYPIINGQGDKNATIQIGTVEKPVFLKNLFYKAYDSSNDTGSRMIPFSFYGDNAEYKAFFESVDEALIELRDKYCTPTQFKEVSKKSIDAFIKTWEHTNKKNKLRELKKENPNLSDIEINKLIKEDAYKHASEKANKEWEDKMVIDYEPLIVESGEYNDKNGNAMTSKNLKLSLQFRVRDDYSGDVTNFEKYHGPGDVRPITFADVLIWDPKLGKRDIVRAILTLKPMSLTYRKDKLGGRFFIASMAIIDKPPREPLASAINYGDDHDVIDKAETLVDEKSNNDTDNNVPGTKRSFSDTEFSNSESVKKASLINENNAVINEDDIAALESLQEDDYYANTQINF